MIQTSQQARIQNTEGGNRMKTVRAFVIIAFLNTVIGFLISFVLFSMNLRQPVERAKSYPFDAFPLYRLLPSGEVEIGFFHIIIAAILLALPITFIVLLFNRSIGVYFGKKGRI
jgi:hypothetical protein